MTRDIEVLRAQLREPGVRAGALLRAMLENIGADYRRRVLQSFEAQLRALPYALQELAPNEATDDDLQNIVFAVAVQGFTPAIARPLEGAARFSRGLEKRYGVERIQIGAYSLTSGSRREIERITMAFYAMLHRNGLDFVVTAGDSRQLIEVYFSEYVTVDEFKPWGPDDAEGP